jgi:hypothetical protein
MHLRGHAITEDITDIDIADRDLPLLCSIRASVGLEVRVGRHGRNVQPQVYAAGCQHLQLATCDTRRLESI